MKISLDDYLAGKPYELTEEQYAYCHDVIYGDNHVGNFSVAGSGKSLCLEIIKDILGDSCVVCATTGIANSILFDNKGGQGTAHKVFSLATEIYNSYHEKKVGKETSMLFATSDLVRVVIIEEAGMLNPDQLSLILKRKQRYDKAYRSKRKKRDIKIVLQGDFLQLGSVYTEEEEIQYMRDTYGSEYLFESEPFKTLKMNIHLFTKVLRTNDKILQAALDVVRYSEKHRYDGVLKWLNKRNIPAPRNALMIATTNKEVDKANKRAMMLNANPEVKLYAETTGDFDLKSCAADEIISLKVGCPVISLINDREDGNYFNGSFGYVEAIYVGEGVVVKFEHSGETHMIPYFDYEDKEYYTDTDPETGEDYMASRVVGTCRQCPIKLAACFSVFRVQGKTIDSPVVIDLGRGFPESQDNTWGMAQAYTALSRVKKIENLYLKTRLTKKHLKANERAVKWVLENMERSNAKKREK